MLTDFGVARAFASGIDSDGDSIVTRTGFVVGSPRYMSPEQAVGERELDGRSDIYSLGLVGYEMFAGSAPFTGSSPMQVLTKQLTEAPPPLALPRPDLPRGDHVHDRPRAQQAARRSLGQWGGVRARARGCDASQPDRRGAAHDVADRRVAARRRSRPHDAGRRAGSRPRRSSCSPRQPARSRGCARAARRVASIRESRSSSRRSRSSVAASSSPGCARGARACSRSTSRSGPTSAS